MGRERPDDEPGTPPSAEDLGGLSVLVVDDEPVVRAFVARALAVSGIEVAVAAEGREALRLVAEDRVRPRVVLTDIEMPGMSGVELAARLLAIRPSIRIVMMTGDAERAEAARRHPGIVDDVLLKPMRIDEIVDTVRAVASADLADRDARPWPRATTAGTGDAGSGGPELRRPEPGQSKGRGARAGPGRP